MDYDFDGTDGKGGTFYSVVGHGRRCVQRLYIKQWHCSSANSGVLLEMKLLGLVCYLLTCREDVDSQGKERGRLRLS